jgi:hypothetical protein
LIARIRDRFMFMLMFHILRYPKRRRASLRGYRVVMAVVFLVVIVLG